MTALTNPLSVADDALWLGAPPVPGGRGISLTPAGIVLHDLDVAAQTIPWPDVTGLDLTIAVSRWRRPAVASWTLGMLGAALDIFSPGLADDIGLRIESASGAVEHEVSAHNRGGYPRDKVEALEALLDLWVRDPRTRRSLASPEEVREVYGRAADVVKQGGSPADELRSLADLEPDGR